MTVMGLSETTVLMGPMVSEYSPEIRNDPEQLAEAQRHNREYRAREWAGLLREALAIVRRIPREDIVPELGASP